MSSARKPPRRAAPDRAYSTELIILKTRDRSDSRLVEYLWRELGEFDRAELVDRLTQWADKLEQKLKRYGGKKRMAMATIADDLVVSFTELE